MGLQFWVSLSANIAMVAIALYTALLQRRQLGLMAKARGKKANSAKQSYWPLMTMVLLAASCWVPYFFSTPTSAPGAAYLEGWGPALEPGYIPKPGEQVEIKYAQVIANGRMLQEQREHYRLAGVCFRYGGLGDPDDATSLQKSALYEIRNESIPIIIPLDSAFQAQTKSGIGGTNYRLLLVPNGVNPAQFSTFHEAYSLGIKVIGTGGGPP